MNAKTRTVMTLVAVMLTFGLFPLEQSASAQSPRSLLGVRGNSSQAVSAQSANSNCKLLKGDELDVFDFVTHVSTGGVTNAGFLNGTTIWNFHNDFVFTPDPDVVAILADLTITTNEGQLKTRVVNTFSIVTGLGNAWGSIDPNASTGRFAGATGTIFFDGFVPPVDVVSGPLIYSVAGQICFPQ
ncbi:MAG TPA: hypothetical protein VE135_13310 [Pyrinomonadaceae bacterium]|nr:hypothetical protein [Pyrinomonadaceae bacterium]